MSRSRAAASIVGSPVLLGAITLLVVIVAVFLAYNANKGLPFVPTYNVRVETPSAASLVEGNEVRVAGYRVGTVDAIRTRSMKGRSVALLDLKLDKKVEPLSTDTQIVVRSRSLLGLKYVDIRPGSSGKAVQPGATLPLQNSEQVVEFDDLLNTFDAQARRDSQTSLAGFGDAFAGRGQSINIALQELPDLFEHLTPVMDTLNDEDTQLDQFFQNLGEAAAEAAPVARTQAKLFTEMADTFEAISSSPPALRETISRQPPLYEAGVEKFPFQRRFLANFTDLSNKLRPAAEELDRALPRITSAFVEGTKTNRRLPILNRETSRLLAALDHLAEDPNTLLALKDLTVTTNVLEPLIELVAPYNTVCNQTNYFFTSLADHASDAGDPRTGASGDGTAQRINLRSSNSNTQDDRFQNDQADRPVDISKDEEPHLANDSEGTDLANLTAQAYNPAIDAAGNADCQAGQWGKLHGGPELNTGGRYEPAEFEEEETEQVDNPDPKNDPDDDRFTRNDDSGGSHVVLNNNTPGLAGPTFTGVPDLEDVDKDLGR